MRISAAVVRAPGAPFSIESLELDDPRPDEIRVRIVATGLCHTDLVVRDQLLPTPLPAVLGHEGSGVVEAVGEAVVDLAIGDYVVLAFASCHECPSCKANEPGYCVDFTPLNFAGSRVDGSKALHDASGDVSSHFFGQSSFATHVVVAAKNAVKVPSSAPLELLGPLGCGVITGAGTMLNTLGATRGDVVVVSGGGPVGLSGVMAAAAMGVETIILVDPLASRREFALTIGATDVIDPAAGDVAASVRAIAPGGANRILETSGRTRAVEGVIAALGIRGRLAMVGVPKSLDDAVSVPVLPMLALGASVCGVTEGDADPHEFIPRLIELQQAGRFPFEKLMTCFPLDQINEAIEAQRAGRCVKAVLTMP